jgi:hypothetical protein
MCAHTLVSRDLLQGFSLCKRVGGGQETQNSISVHWEGQLETLRHMPKLVVSQAKFLLPQGSIHSVLMVFQ